MKGYLVYEYFVNEDSNEVNFHNVYLNKKDAYKKVEELINENETNGNLVYCKFMDIDMDDDINHINNVYIFVQEVEIIEKKPKFIGYGK